MRRRRPTIAIVAGTEFLELDGSWPLLRDALVQQGLDAQVVVWDDPDMDWHGYALVLVIYAWGFVTRRQEFLRWARRVTATSQVVNSLPLLEWNSEKTYLSDLARDAVPVVPTMWVPPGASWQPPSVDYVVKPAVASGGIGAARYVCQERTVACDHVRRLHEQGHTAMVQPYQASIDESGETALVFLDGRYSHAINKRALLQPDVGEVDRLWEQETVRPVAPRADQQAVAEQAIKAVTRRVERPLYARVDLVDGTDGRPLVLELELVEPSLFFPEDGVAATRLARCLRRAIPSDRTVG